MKPVATILRAVAILTFLILAQLLSDQISIIVQKTYNMQPLLFTLPVISILFGALLHSDVLFRKNLVFRIDWLSLLLIGLPSLLIAFATPILHFVLPNVPIQQFAAIFYHQQIMMLSGAVFGYTVINSLFRVQAPKENETPRG